MYFTVMDAECDHTDLVELSVGAEHERQDMKHFDPYHSSRLVPFSKKRRLLQIEDEII